MGICLYSSACAKSVLFTLSGECFSSGKSVTYSLEDLDGCLEMTVGLGSDNQGMEAMGLQ